MTNEVDQKAATEPPFDCQVRHEPAGEEDRAVYDAIAANYWRQRPDCNTCANRGTVDGLSQETHCEHCQWQQTWRTNHYAPNALAEPTERR